MEKYIIRGGKKLSGTVLISGAKNSVLKLMAASLLTEDTSQLVDIPLITDVYTMAEVLRELGVEINLDNSGRATITPGKRLNHIAPYELVSRMRASIIVLGPLVTRLGQARVAMPGGCNIGTRKIDLHLKGLSQLGAQIEVGHGFIEARTDELKGCAVDLDFPSVGATENLIMAAVLAKGTTILNNAAREPEIVDLANFLNRMGAKITGEGTSTIEIEGCSSLHGVHNYKVIPDRIEAGTYMLAAAITGGEVTIKNCIPKHLSIFIEKLRQTGTSVLVSQKEVIVNAEGRPIPLEIATLPYPGFPTDLQPQMISYLTRCSGVSIVSENVFEKRFMYLDELRRMGCKIDLKGHHAIVEGQANLTAAPVNAYDLRGGAALVLAGLAANGQTEIHGIHHINRGYDRLDGKLSLLGADIIKLKADQRNVDLKTV